LRDRVVELTQLDVGGAEIGQGVDPRRVDRERGLVGVDGANQVAGLLHLERTEEDPIEILGAGLSEHGERQNQEEQRGQNVNPNHGSGCGATPACSLSIIAAAVCGPAAPANSLG
jgi:hypothetical protein